MMTHAEALIKAKQLVAKMSLEEKAEQLKYDAPAIDRLGIPAYNWWNEALHGVARAGTATVFPQAIGLAAIFDDAFHYKIADTVSTEGRAKYNEASAEGDRDIYKGLTFWSPNVNIFRDPRWGRGHETYGEDPYLTGKLGVAYVEGLQGSGKFLKSAACAKHFAVHSGPEAIRHEFDAGADKKDMAETYLYAFEMLVRDADVESVMGAYNRVNGEPACGSQKLLVDTLRGEWGFEGHVVSDCWAVRDFHEHHHVTDTAPESAAMAINHGCDLNCGNTYLHMMQAVKDGLVSDETITRACERLFATRYRLGLLGQDSEWDAISPLENDTDEHNELAYEAAVKSMVLLKNDGVLPICGCCAKTIAVIGPNANSVPALEGNYNGTSSRYITLLEGIRQGAPEGTRVLYSEGCHLFKDRVSNLGLKHDRIAEAVSHAKIADVTVLCLGLDATLEGEEGDTGNQYFSGDKKDLELPGDQKLLLDSIVAVGKPVITVVCSGSSLNVSEGNAVIEAWYPGQAGGRALCDLIYGRRDFSGRLPLTFYRSVDDLPDFADYAMRKGRTYRYYQGKPLFPFGFGLSYTRFEVTGASYVAGEVQADVRNIGERDGECVVEVYVKQNGSALAPANPSLCAFGRVAVKAGETATITMPMAEKALLAADNDGKWVKDASSYTLYIGQCQPDTYSLELSGTKPVVLEIK